MSHIPALRKGFLRNRIFKKEFKDLNICYSLEDEKNGNEP